MAKNISPKIFRKYLLRLPVSLSPLDRSSSRGFGTLSEVGRQRWSQASNPSSLSPSSQPQCAAASTNRKSRNTVLEHGVAGTQAVPGGGRGVNLCVPPRGRSAQWSEIGWKSLLHPRPLFLLSGWIASPLGCTFPHFDGIGQLTLALSLSRNKDSE